MQMFRSLFYEASKRHRRTGTHFHDFPKSVGCGIRPNEPVLLISRDAIINSAMQQVRSMTRKKTDSERETSIHLLRGLVGSRCCAFRDPILRPSFHTPRQRRIKFLRNALRCTGCGISIPIEFDTLTVRVSRRIIQLLYGNVDFRKEHFSSCKVAFSFVSEKSAIFSNFFFKFRQTFDFRWFLN